MMRGLTAVVTARRALGSCDELAERDGWGWMQDWSLESAGPFWRALLPCLESLPVAWEWFDRHAGLVEALRRIGAPKVRTLKLIIDRWGDGNASHFVSLVESLPLLTGLEELEFGSGALPPAASRALGGVIERAATAGGPPFLPSLRSISLVDECFCEMKGWQSFVPSGVESFVEAMRPASTTTAGLFLGIEKMTIDDRGGYGTARGVVRILAAGAFPNLWDLYLGGGGFDDDALLPLLGGPQPPAACLRNLRVLTLRGMDINRGSGLGALGALMAAGGMPALEELRVSNSREGDAGLAAFCRALSPAAAPLRLRVFHWNFMELRDEGTCALADAIERGALGSRLEEFRLYQGFSFYRDVGAAALVRAFAGAGRQYVSGLRTIVVSLQVSQERADLKRRFTDAVRLSCPALEKLDIS